MVHYWVWRHQVENVVWGSEILRHWEQVVISLSHELLVTVALFLVVCVVTICNICPHSNMLMLRRPSYNNIGLESIVGLVLQQMLSDRNLISMIRLFILFVHLKLLPIIFFLHQFSTSFPSFSLDVSRAALFSACESVVATFFWKDVNVLTTHLFRDFLDYCLFFVLLLNHTKKNIKS